MLRPPVTRMNACAAAFVLSTILGCGGGGGDNPASAWPAIETHSAGNLGAAKAAGTAAPSTLPTATTTAAAPAPNREMRALAPEEQPALPYKRIVRVDAAHPQASDTSSAAGTATAPYRTISAALRGLQGGDDIVVASGIYREFLSVPSLAAAAASDPLPVRLRAAVPRGVVAKGSDAVVGWAQTMPGRYRIAWTGDEPQQVFRDGVPLQQVGGTVFGGYPTQPGHELALQHVSEGGIWPGRVTGSMDSAAGDAFLYDPVRRELTVKLTKALAAGEALEVASRQLVLQAENAVGLTIEGLNFAHANTSVASRWGAVKVSGRNNRLDNIEVRDMDSICLQISGSDTVLSNSVVERCGRLGIAGTGTRMSIVGNRVTGNNTRGFNQNWEAGGMKLIGNAGLHDSTIRGNVAAYNRGDGIWVDWMNSNNLIEENTTAYNGGFGIHYEASRSGTIRSNLAYGNAYRGIYLLESADTTIEGNTVVGNMFEGIGIVDGNRSATFPQLRPTGNRVTGNVMAWNDFNRNWVQLVLPGAPWVASSDRNTFVAEKLAPRMSYGFVAPGNEAYTTLQAWVVAMKQDQASQSYMMPMPAALQAQLAKQRLLSAAELQAYLAPFVAN